MKRFLIAIAGMSMLVVFLLIAGPSLSAQAAAPAVPHPVTLGPCLSCHGPQGVKPGPANHSAFNEGMCLTCHAAPQAATPPTSPPPSQPATAPAADAPATSTNACLDCHGKPGLKTSTRSGETIDLLVDPGVYASSIHGDKLLCTDCHNSITGYPHPKRDIADRRQYSIALYESCKKCHFDNYTKTMDSVHYKIFSGGNREAPLCTDCHGAHSVGSPAQPRSAISQTCSKCHEPLYEIYATSIHGKALISENNFDVPVCTDCHLSHTIEDPRTASFRLSSVKLCSNCHTDAALMAKYDISTKVVSTYLEDFHGRTVSLVGKEDKKIWVDAAVCTDCHGVHNIMQVDAASSPVIKANLVVTCQRCHPEASTNFPAAWLSHYEPSPTQAPLVFYVRIFYMLMIPFILVGLSVHILLDLWRTITNR